MLCGVNSKLATMVAWAALPSLRLTTNSTRHPMPARQRQRLQPVQQRLRHRRRLLLLHHLCRLPPCRTHTHSWQQVRASSPCISGTAISLLCLGLGCVVFEATDLATTFVQAPGSVYAAPASVSPQHAQYLAASALLAQQQRQQQQQLSQQQQQQQPLSQAPLAALAMMPDGRAQALHHAFAQPGWPAGVDSYGGVPSVSGVPQHVAQAAYAAAMAAVYNSGAPMPYGSQLPPGYGSAALQLAPSSHGTAGAGAGGANPSAAVYARGVDLGAPPPVPPRAAHMPGRSTTPLSREATPPPPPPRRLKGQARGVAGRSGTSSLAEAAKVRKRSGTRVCLCNQLTLVCVAGVLTPPESKRQQAAAAEAGTRQAEPCCGAG